MNNDLGWSERIRLDQIGGGIERRLEPDEATRARIAKALDLADLSQLQADLSLLPAGAGWRLKGVIQADVVQTCGITLEPLPAHIETRFAVDLVEGEQDEDLILEGDPEGPDGPDVIQDGGVDMAAYVVEHLSLALDPWPRKPGAEFVAPDGPAEPSPFAVLKDLKPRS